MNLFKIPCALTLLALASAPESVYANEGGWYTTAIFGVASQSDQALDFTGNGNPQTANSRLSSGLLAGAALGYGFASGWRVEGEFIYQSVDAKDPGLLPSAPVGKGDYASTFPSFMPVLSLDRVFLNQLKAISATTLDKGIWRSLSDHLPVYVEIEIDP